MTFRRRPIASTFVFLFLMGFSFLFQNCAKSNLSSPSSLNNPKTHIGINAVGGWSDSPFISRDGKRLYFMYSRYNFGPFLKSGGSVMPVASGPSRPGLHQSNAPFDESDIYMATKNPDGTWSEPISLGFNGAYGDACGMEINNGDTFIWLRGNGSANNIVMANKNSDGSWGTPVDLGAGINNHAVGVIQDNPYISADGKVLFFVSSRAGGFGGKDIWVSTNSSGTLNGTWSAPVNMGALVNTTGDEDQPWISSVSMDVYWNGPQGIMHCISNGTNCSGTPTIVSIPGCAYAAEVSMPDDMSIMYFGCGDPTTFEVKIMYSVKQPNGSWGTATPVD